MDDLRGYDRDEPATGEEVSHETPPAIGSDERRMHVRAYNHWVSLLAGRPFPSIADLRPQSLGDFGPHSVLLDFSADPENPGVRFLGSALERECATGADIHTIADVPPRSLLSRLTDHYLQIIANRAPIGFEAEFVSQRGLNTLYRGIVMPFSSDGNRIDYLYGVINWKELANVEITSQLLLDIDRELRSGSVAAGDIWADGPATGALLEDVSSAAGHVGTAAVLAFDDGDLALADRLAAARAEAAQFGDAHGRSRTALYRALGLAYDFALIADERPDEFAELAEDAGVRVHVRAPMTAVIRLVFGADYDKSRVTEFAAVLAHARRACFAGGTLAREIERVPGGMKALVAEERRARQMTPRRALADRAFDALRRAPVQGEVTLASGDDEFVLLIARRASGDRLAVLAPVPHDAALVERAVRRIAR